MQSWLTTFVYPANCTVRESSFSCCSCGCKALFQSYDGSFTVLRDLLGWIVARSNHWCLRWAVIRVANSSQLVNFWMQCVLTIGQSKLWGSWNFKGLPESKRTPSDLARGNFQSQSVNNHPRIHPSSMLVLVQIFLWFLQPKLLWFAWLGFRSDALSRYWDGIWYERNNTRTSEDTT